MPWIYYSTHVMRTSVLDCLGEVNFGYIVMYRMIYCISYSAGYLNWGF